MPKPPTSLPWSSNVLHSYMLHKFGCLLEFTSLQPLSCTGQFLGRGSYPSGRVENAFWTLPSEEFELTAKSLGAQIETHGKLILRTFS